MKIFILAALLLTNAAHASYYATFCSSADGSVRWESGHNSNTIKFEYYGENGKESQTFPLSEVELSPSDTTIISENTVNNCRMVSTTKVYVETVKVSAAEGAVNVASVLNDQFGGQIKTEVICRFSMNGRTACTPEEQEEDKPTENR